MLGLSSLRHFLMMLLPLLTSGGGLLSLARRAVASSAAMAVISMLPQTTIVPAPATADSSASVAIAPDDKDNNLVRIAFKDFNEKRFTDADREFSLAIDRWKDLARPRDEMVSLFTARGSVRMDSKQFDSALRDFNAAIDLMKVDGEKPDGTASYPEYPSTFVERGLCYEGKADWAGALGDYDKAIELWGGGRGENINPYVLNYRGNALTRLDRYDDAILDYDASANSFLAQRDIARYSESRANEALALYEVGRVDEGLKAMNDVVRKNPGFADMRVALAAHYWSVGDYINALKEWRFVCDNISVGCVAYEDIDWLRNVRRWPSKMVKNFESFYKREIPDGIKGNGEQRLAPSVGLKK